MENLILNRKQIALEKNKEFLFKIPILIKPMECEFQIETSDVNLRATHSEFGTGGKAVQIPITLTDRITKIPIQSLELNFELQGEYLLFACSSNKSIQFALSVSRNFARFY
jgi:hypothetical protein